MTINFTCHEQELKNIEGILFAQEYLTPPNFDRVEVQTEKENYYYRIQRYNDKWYIVTD